MLPPHPSRPRCCTRPAPLTLTPRFRCNAHNIISYLDKKADAAIQLVKPFLSNAPLSLKLLSAQMSIHQHDLPAAIAILDALVKEETLRLGIVSALSKLHVAAGDVAAGIATIDATIKRAKRGPGLWPLIQDAVRLHEQAGNVQSAAAALEKYSNSGPRQNLTLAHLVELTARFDSDRAEKLSLGLPPLPVDPSIDVDALENASSRRGAAPRALAAEAGASSRKGGVVDADRVARIRVRRKAKKTKALKNKLGAAFNPKHQPDVNKWLPCVPLAFTLCIFVISCVGTPTAPGQSDATGRRMRLEAAREQLLPPRPLLQLQLRRLRPWLLLLLQAALPLRRRDRRGAGEDSSMLARA